MAKEKKESNTAAILAGIVILLILFGIAAYTAFVAEPKEGNGAEELPEEGQAKGGIGFEEALGSLNSINAKYGLAFFTVPSNAETNIEVLEEVKKEAESAELSEEAAQLYEIKLKLLESNQFFMEGWKYGKGSTTQYGFGCKSLERIRNATYSRNISASIGLEAAELVNGFVNSYPEEAEAAGITKGAALVLKTSYELEMQSAKKDRNIVEKLCVK